MMKHLKLTVFFLALLSVGLQSLYAAGGKKQPQKGYRFTLFIYDNTDSVMYLGNYYAGATYAFDTAYKTPKGMFVFENKERELKPGLYFFVNKSGTYVDFAIYGGEKLNFHFDTEEPGWQTNMNVKGSEENKLLFDFHKANRAVYRVADSAIAQTTDSVEIDRIRRWQNKALDSVKYYYLGKKPNSMLSLLMNATREPDVPETDANGVKLNDRQKWEYLMDHYFDYTSLDDDALIRTPPLVFKRRLDRYLDSYLKNAPPEIVIEYVDKLIDKAQPSKENFRYLVHTLAEKYLQSNVMSYDAVYVHLVKRYIEPGLCEWMSPSTVDMNVKRADKWDKLLIGKPAPLLIMKDDKGQWQNLYALNNKYTLLVFWSPTCGHCKLIIPDLYKRFEKYRDRCDIGAFAILSEPDDETRPKWHEFIKNNNLKWLNIDGGEANVDWHEVYDIETTPQIYLLDKDKKILAKKLNGETFEDVIKILEKIE
ncbi:MAG: DUF5106 domain-containing protein [Bacteroidales bacterium]|nr:DUF5106 domain-containing protein [Bacteroidales bacterium]